MNVLSLFDGMAGAYEALKRNNIKVNNYYASEVDKYAIKVAMKNHPDIIQLGDIKKIKGDDLPPIDLLIGGSPCPSFSMAGKRLGFDDPRGQLFFEYLRLLKKVKPTYFLMENVCMKKEFENAISELLGVKPILINSALVSAQSRKRLYWTNIPNVGQPPNLGITWGDVKETGVNSISYYYTEAALQWLGRHSQKHNKMLKVFKDDEKMQMIEASHCKKYSAQRFFGIPDVPTDEQGIASLRGRYLIDGVRQDHKMKTAGKTQQYIEFRYDDKTNTVMTSKKNNIVVPFTLPHRVPKDEFFFRYITVLECERLQTLTDGYTEGVSNTQRYKMIGNGFTVDVIAHILSYM